MGSEKNEKYNFKSIHAKLCNLLEIFSGKISLQIVLNLHRSRAYFYFLRVCPANFLTERPDFIKLRRTA